MTTQEVDQYQGAMFPDPMKFLQYFTEPTLIMGLYTNDEGKHFTRLYMQIPDGSAIAGPLMTHIPHDNEEDARQEAVDINSGSVVTYPHAVLPKIESVSEPHIDFTKGEWVFSIRASVEFGDFGDNHDTFIFGEYELSFPDEYSAKTQFKIIAEENVKFNEAVEDAKQKFAAIISDIKNLKAET